MIRRQRAVAATPHAIASSYAREQLRARASIANARPRTRGEYVLYWMQSTQRLEDNWALRGATRLADRLDLPLLVYQGLDPTYPYASDRVHTFVLQGARAVARRADASGLSYRFALRRRRADDRRVVDRLAARASCVVTDLYPTAGVAERTRRVAARATCQVIAIESVGVVPAATIPREELAARTIRPKLLRELAHWLEPVEDRPPRRAMPPALLASLEADFLDPAVTDIAAAVAACEIDHAVGPVDVEGGLAPARARLAAFVLDGLPWYHERRRDPVDEAGASRLSRWLHFGMLSAAEVVRAVLAARGAADPGAAAFLDELLVWRELALNFCLRNSRYAELAALPAWVHRSMAAHDADPREALYPLDVLERGATESALWNAAQHELRRTGTMHNAVRQLWGKTVLSWTPTYDAARRALLRLNDRWALDGRDPNSYAGIQWCFGKFDRPFPERPVWGAIRPMSLARARAKYDVDAYAARWRV